MTPDTYVCLKHPCIALGDYAIRAIQPQDIEDIRQWRNAQIDVLRQDGEITPDMQVAYFDTQIWPTFSQANPRQILVTHFHRDLRIGYGGLVHMAWAHARAAVSFLVAPDIAADDARYGEAFDAFFSLIKTLAFEDLGLNRLTTETYASRTKHIDVRYHFVRERIEREELALEYVQSKSNTADVFTKGLERELFVRHRGGMKVRRLD